MFALPTEVDYLPTDLGFPFPESDLFLWGAVILIAVAFTYFADDEFRAAALCAVLGMSMFVIPSLIQFNENQETITKNRVDNVKRVYDVDDVMLETWSESSPKVFITKDGKSYEVLLNENKNTFEPILSTLNNDSFDVEKLKRTAE